MTIKEPSFDKPIGVGATGEIRVVDPDGVVIEAGRRIQLIYRRRPMTVRVTTVEAPNEQFVGEVQGFDHAGLEHEGLRHGDLVRFRRRDIRLIGD